MLFTSIKPMLAVEGRHAFDDPGWIFQPLWDGARMLIHKQGERIEAYDRKGRIMTYKLPELCHALESIRGDRIVLDCEAVCFRDNKPYFDDIRYRIRLENPLKIDRASVTRPVTFIAFDLLYQGTIMTGEPLKNRLSALEQLVRPANGFLTSISAEGRGISLRNATVEKGLEGVIAKRADSTYSVGTRSADWIKLKNKFEIEAVILGYRQEPAFALIVGLHFPTVANKQVAVVSQGITEQDREAFIQAASPIRSQLDNKTQWLKPVLCCTIEYSDRTEMHQLSGTRFKRFLVDKDPKDCRWGEQITVKT